MSKKYFFLRSNKLVFTVERDFWTFSGIFSNFHAFVYTRRLCLTHIGQGDQNMEYVGSFCQMQFV
jgi:hypothetical protein